MIYTFRREEMCMFILGYKKMLGEKLQVKTSGERKKERKDIQTL